jgi:hypothetical protein
MAVNGRRKGKTGELEAASTLRAMFGWAARRRQQFSGKAGDDDLMVDQTPSLFWEVKRVERLNIPKTMRVAAEQAGRRCPVIMHRPNRGDWLLTLRLSDLPRLVHAYETAIHDPMASSPLPSEDPRGGAGSEEASGGPRDDRDGGRPMRHTGR